MKTHLRIALCIALIVAAGVRGMTRCGQAVRAGEQWAGNRWHERPQTVSILHDVGMTLGKANLYFALATGAAGLVRVGSKPEWFHKMRPAVGLRNALLVLLRAAWVPWLAWGAALLVAVPWAAFFALLLVWPRFRPGSSATAIVSPRFGHYVAHVLGPLMSGLWCTATGITGLRFAYNMLRTPDRLAGFDPVLPVEPADQAESGLDAPPAAPGSGDAVPVQGVD